MRLTVYTDYSLRMLIYLATKTDGLATIAEVAQRYGISEHHLTKVAHQLGRAGYVATLRGKGGGLRLARPAREIGLGEVVRQTEPDMALVPCFSSPEAPNGAPCPIAPACGLRGVLGEAMRAFMAVLDRYTLDDLVQQRAELRSLLTPADAANPAK
jgi:Rrf2 family nitric oxide-sensitive transcriptional repressor